ncbi:hypothetical protein ACJ73_04996, partial [Blastomyces percursus]
MAWHAKTPASPSAGFLAVAGSGIGVGSGSGRRRRNLRGPLDEGSDDGKRAEGSSYTERRIQWKKGSNRT